MRASLSAAAVLIASLGAVGCSQMAAPTEPAQVRSTAPPSVSQPAGTIIAALGGSASTDVVRVPVSVTIQSSGKAAIQACVGETVNFAGDALVLAHTTSLPDGSTSLDLLHFNPQGAVAVGASTGLTYRLVGGDSNPIVIPPSGGLTATFAANLIAIGPGSARNFLAHILEHITVTPDGDITALIDIFSVECR